MRRHYQARKGNQELEELAYRMIEVYDEAIAALGPDLGGGSVLDLMADQFADVPLETLREALRVAGIEVRNA